MLRVIAPYSDRTLLGAPAPIAAVCEAIERMPRRRRQIFLLREVDGWPTARVADELRLTPAAVEVELGRAILSVWRRLG